MRREHDDDLERVLEHVEHAQFSVRQEARQYAAGMKVVE